GNLQAADIVEILKKRLAFMAGGEDKKGNTLVSVPSPCDDFRLQDFKDTLTYLGTLSHEDDDDRGVTVVIQGDSSWGDKLGPLMDVIQDVLGERLDSTLVLRPHKSKDLKASPRDKQASSIQGKYVSQAKLFKLISPLQLTPEFGGTLEYDHYDWLSRQLAVEKYIKEVKLLSKHTDVALGFCRLQTSPGSPDVPHRIGPAMGEVISRTVQSGQRLLESLQCDGEFGFKSHCGQRMVKERGSAYRKVKAAVDCATQLQQSFQEDWEREVELLRGTQQLETFYKEVETMLNWTSAERDRLLQSGTKSDLDRANAMAMDIFARYSRLRQFSSSLCKELPHEADNICSAMSQLDLACEDFASRFNSPRECLSPVLDQELQQFWELLSSIESRLKSPADDDIRTTKEVDKLLTELQETSFEIESHLQTLRETFQSYGESSEGEIFWLIREQMSHIKALLSSRKNELVQAGQFLCCEENALQLVSWLDKLNQLMEAKFLKAGHKLTQVEHDRMDDMARGTYHYGLRLLDDAVKLRKLIGYGTAPSTRVADALFDAWVGYVTTSKCLRRSEQLPTAAGRELTPT
ncbi:unnamed protein product, partial [Ixodes hexagonus]